ncbi:MAG TPA: crosslink repair DNA glycosylase YcaQ family protein [Vicinamibacterales bacterium]|nr:crosslink repair DNA glycosylase YcaQ family protein [Vicinamibacterales bacterium]
MARSLFTPRTLEHAFERFGFVQADPIRAPARAQDLTLRHRVAGYKAGDLDRLYGGLGVEEDVFINYGFVSRELHALMHPREQPPAISKPRSRRQKLLAFVRDKGDVHPTEVDAHFAHGTVTNYWGGSSNATTHLLEDMHYRGWLRVTGRDKGIRRYAIRPDTPLPRELSRQERIDSLVDVVVNKYAPLPAPSLAYVVGRLRYAVPQWRGLIPTALERARRRLVRERVHGIDWYWPAGEHPESGSAQDDLRFLTPFDPIVWDRRRFELLWGWPYRFEAYTPAKKRRFGYYAMPVLWRSEVIGWANLSVVGGTLDATFGYAARRPPRDRAFSRQLDREVERFKEFLALPT